LSGNRVQGKVALVTGAARGLGAEYASILAEEGAAVVVADILDERGEAHASSLRAAGFNAEYHHLDVTKEADWQRVCEATRERHGAINILVNNAGIARMENLLNETLEGWNAVIAVNQTGPFLGMQHCVPMMIESGGGSVINIVSIWGLLGGPNLVAYHAAKASLLGLSKNAAVMLAPQNVRVNTICPGAVLTEMVEEEEREVPGTVANVLALVPMRRAATTRELANAVLFLASDESSYITGLDVRVDGGMAAGFQFRPPAG
jgi:NAD(P)-dependent dehydrogenase (short-subunit alcohol dehydrogenase family)